MKPPAAYYGGKIRLAPQIVSLMPRHAIYIEPFFGTGAVFFAKRRAAVEVINDRDDAVVAFFRCLRDRPEELVRACALTPYARTEYSLADLDGPGRPTDDLELARCWWVRVRQGMGKTGGRRTGWSISTVRNVSQARCTQRALNRFYEVAERLAQVQIENKPAVDVIAERGMTADAVIYADPPYPISTRVVKSGGDYRHEMTDDDHRALAEVLRSTDAAVFLSSYPSALYDELYDGWGRIEVAVTTSGANINHDGRARAPRTEVIWSNRQVDSGTLWEVS